MGREMRQQKMKWDVFSFSLVLISPDSTSSHHLVSHLTSPVIISHLTISSHLSPLDLFVSPLLT
jgi:hypothetical protein